MSGIDPAYVPLVVALVLVILVLAWQGWKRRLQAWKTFAARHDWSFSNRWGSLEIQGLFLGQQLSVLTERRGAGKNRREVTVLRLELAALPSELTLEPEGLGDKLLKFFGRRDEEVGDAEFDAAFDLEDVSPETRALLRKPRVREQLLMLKRTFSRFSIEAGLLEAERRGVPHTVEALESLVAPALELARALHEAGGGTREQMRG
jgi:hypothetical protein